MGRLTSVSLAVLLVACSGDSSSSADSNGEGASGLTGATSDASSGDGVTGDVVTGGGMTGGGSSGEAVTGSSGVPDPTTGETGETGGSETGETSESSETGNGDTSDTGEPFEPVCPVVPACASVEATATEHHLSLLDGCAFAVAPNDFAAGLQRADELLARVGTAVGIDAVLGQLNRVAVPGLSAYQADRMKNHDYVGFRWNDGDGSVDYWYPQGISGGSDAREDSRVSGRRVVLVSWYHNIEREPDDPPARGVRLSLVDITDLDDIHYRHMLLVTPTGGGDTVNFAAANNGSGDALHAGGITWVGDRLYVAETYAGFRVYDMSRIFEVSSTDDEAAIGISGGEVNAHGYRYAVPEIGRYTLTDSSCPFRFSAVALDRGAAPPVLVTAEYQTDLTGRVARWPIDLTTAALVASDGTVHAVDAALSGQSRVQGAVTHDGVYYLSSSSQADQWGRLYRNVPDATSEITAWPDGPEDLYIERDLGLIWTTAEHPDKRVTLGIPMQGY